MATASSTVKTSSADRRRGVAIGRRRQWLQTRDLLRELIARDIKLRYQGSILGLAWTLLNPIAELLVLLFIFGTVLRVDIPNYAAYLFTGLLVYGWFQQSLNYATTAIIGNRELVRRPGVPSIILPMVTVASNLVHFVLSLPILLVLLIANGIQITAAIFALPLLVAIQFALILGLAYPVATIHVWFRDTQHLLRVILQLLFYLTPVFYDTNSAPAAMQPIFLINPLTHLVAAYREVLLHGELPAWTTLAPVTIASLLMLMAGIVWFRRVRHRFADEL